MKVIKRSGRPEDVSFDKITARIKKLCYGLDENFVDHINVTKKVIQGLYDGVTTVELDNLAAETAASMSTVHPDYAQLAARIAISNLHKETDKSFSSTMEGLYNYVDPKTGDPAGLIGDDTMAVIRANKSRLDAAIIYDRDFEFDYFGYKTLERSYLMRMDGAVVERPQQMLMRVAVGIHQEDIESAIQTYQLMSEKWFIHATPTLFNSGTPKPQMSSCFLLSLTEDSIEGIFETLRRCARISQAAGGIGLSIHNVRATGSYIKGTGGTSNGIVPMLKVFNDTARYVDQGGGKRKGAFAVYLEPWHADIFDFLDLKKNHGKEEMRARDLFYALWMNDLFMERVKADGEWSLFDPNEAPGLFDAYGGEFEALYHQYEAEGKARRTVKAQELWFAILDSQIETGTPYILYKDAANKKSNQQNLGTIRSSNLCCIAADQRVVTDRGMVTIGELYAQGGKNQVAGRTQIRTASEMFLPRPDGEMLKIHTKEGYTHKVTPDHKVWVEGLGWKEAQDLEPGDRLTIQQYEGLFGNNHLPDEAFLTGLIAGDGTFSASGVHVDVWDNASDQLPLIEEKVQNLVDHYEQELDYDNLTGNEHAGTFAPSLAPAFVECKTPDNATKYRLSSSVLGYVLEAHGFTRETKHQVPQFVWKGTRETVAQYLRGLYLADGTVQAGEITTCSLASIHRDFLADIQIIWANFGVKTSLTQMREEQPQLLPDGKGGKAYYTSKALYRLHITSIRGCRIAEEITGIGGYRKNDRFLANIEKQGYRQKLWATFERNEPLPNEDAYCLLVDSEEHSWTVNGLITKNTEIMEYTSPDEVAVCNLASLALPKYVKEDKTYDFDRLVEVTRVVTRNLNKVIDRNYYPIEQARNSNMKHRPIGLGVQGLADAFIMMRMPFDSPEARQLNKDIFEAIYFAACTESIALAKELGHYESYPGSPASKGELQYDLWGVTPSDKWDWAGLKKDLAKYGMRNSLLVAPMPTASTSQILGNNECFEAYSSNMYTRRTLSGEFVVVNKHLLHDLIGLGLWDNAMRNRLMAANGSIQDFEDVPQHLRDLYKTVWEISQKVVIDMAADRGAFICQSQSMNLFVENVNFGKLSSMHFYAWSKGLKTGMYYLRTKAARDAIKFTVDKTQLSKQGEEGDGQVKAKSSKTTSGGDAGAGGGATAQAVAAGDVPAAKTATTAKPAASAAGFDELSAADVENVGKACSLDDPDCIACSA